MVEETKEVKKPVWNPDELKGNTFEGTVTGAEIAKGESRSQPGVVKDYLNLTLATSMTDRPFTVRMAQSDRKNSLFGEFLRALKKCRVTIQSEKDLIGAKFLFERQDVDFGSFQVKDFPFPVQFLGKEKI